MQKWINKTSDCIISFLNTKLCDLMCLTEIHFWSWNKLLTLTLFFCCSSFVLTNQPGEFNADPSHKQVLFESPYIIYWENEWDKISPPTWNSIEISLHVYSKILC